MRDTTFDIMKSIGIIAMIIGHLSIPADCRKFIFIWHMPLFFIISGYFYKQVAAKDLMIKLSKSLIRPYVITSAVLLLIASIKSIIFHNYYIVRMIVGVITASGSSENPFFFSGHCQVGAVWFLFALFWCRLFFNTLNTPRKGSYYNKHSAFCIIVLSYFASFLGQYIYMPLDIFQGLSALIFYYIGFIIHKYNICYYISKTKINLVTALVIGLVCFYIGMSFNIMGMVTCYYEIWPVNVICAIGAFLFVYAIVILLRKFIDLSFLANIGRISILILCVHLIDLESGDLYLLSNMNLQLGKLFVLLLHIIIPITISWFLSKNKVVQQLFNL